MAADDKEQRIRVRAYLIWLEQGMPFGKNEEHWSMACALIDFEDGERAQQTKSRDTPPPGPSMGP